MIGRIALAAAATAAVMLWSPNRALAGSCGGGGGGSSSGGSSSGGGGGSSSSSSSSSEPACIETSSVVGHSECRSFGAGWALPHHMPRIHMTFGTTAHSFGLAGATFDGTASHERDISYRIVGEDMTAGEGGAGALTGDLTVTAAYSRMYAGIQLGLGKVHVSHRTMAPADDLELVPDGGLYGTAGVVAGVSVPLGRLTIKGEAMAGARLISLSVTSYHDDCVSESFVTDVEATVQPRVVAETWITPWFVMGARVGSDLLHEGDMNVGVYVGGYLRAFDATRPR